VLKLVPLQIKIQFSKLKKVPKYAKNKNRREKEAITYRKRRKLGKDLINSI